MSHLILSNADDVQNIQHKHCPRPSDCKSWKAYWCDHSGTSWPETCRVRGCGENADGSAHVNVNGDENNEFIIPMCDEHRSPGFSDIVSVNSGTFAVYIDKDEIIADFFDNLADNFSELSLKGGMSVRNQKDTHLCLPRDYRSWKKYYIHNGEREWPKTCRIGHCAEPAQGGAHVNIDGKCGIFIVPMCQQHNTPQNQEWMPVKKRTIVVPVDQEDTSGPSGICYCKRR